MYIHVPNANLSPSKILLKDVLYAPSMAVTLVSISRVAAAGSTVIFAGDVCRIYDSERKIIGNIKVKGGLYRVYAAACSPFWRGVCWKRKGNLVDRRTPSSSWSRCA